MTENTERRKEDWLDQLGTAVAAAAVFDEPQRGTEPADAPPRLDKPLPSWPWAMSGIGLCLALLALEPGAADRGADRRQPPDMAPQVQGWRATLTSSSTWPEEVPVAGYRGVERPQPDQPLTPLEPKPMVSVIAPSHPTTVEPEPTAVSPPAPPAPIADPVAQSAPPAIAAEPPPLPTATVETAVVPTAAIGPPDFIPPQPAWAHEQPLNTQPVFAPAVAVAKPAPIAKAPVASVERVVAGPRRTSASPRRERSATRAKSAIDIDDAAEPSWRDKIFPNTRD